MQTRVVGVSVPRKEGAAKLTGQARYIDDLSLPGMIFGATVRSSIARGAIEEIRFGEGHRLARVHHRDRQRYSRPQCGLAHHG